MQTLAENVTDTLRGWILHGRVRPAERLEEVPLAAQMGVSRTPVRAALATLANEGLIVHQAKRGYQVREFRMEELVAAYDVRAVLEGLACRNAATLGLTTEQITRLRARLAEGDRILGHGELRPDEHEPYQRMNVDIHETLLDASGNPWVRRFAVQAHNIPFASDRIILWDDHAVILRSHGDHHRVVEAVIARDAARAEQLMREHVYYAGVILRENYLQLLAAGEQAPGMRPSPRVAPGSLMPAG